MASKTGYFSYIVFTGCEGLTCHEFIRVIRERALESGNQRNDEWMADYASIRFEGTALKWFENLDDETQISWKLLRRSLLSKYGGWVDEDSVALSAANVKRPVFTFTGKDKDECRAFIQEIRQRASEEGKEEDSSWMLRLAFPCFSGDALEWHASLVPEVKNNWYCLEKAILVDYPFHYPPKVFPARIRVENWSINVPPSAPLQHVHNREDWLKQARERRRIYQEVKDKSTPCWLLVETEKDIPDVALITGVESSGEPLYSARAWHESSGLIVGKCGRHKPGAGLPLYGREIQRVAPFEVLVGDPSYFRWVAVPYQTQQLNPISDNPFAGVDAGFEIRHRATFICQFKHEGGLCPGKVHSTHPTAEIGYDGKECKQGTHSVRLLAWAD